jgi:hypothetical protein
MEKVTSFCQVRSCRFQDAGLIPDLQGEDRPAAICFEYGELGKTRIEAAVEAKLDRNVAGGDDGAVTGNRFQKR